jgi:hypothetical protein
MRCIFRLLPDFEIYEGPIDWLDKDVTIFFNGKINGLLLAGAEIRKITVTPGTTFKRYIGNTKDYRELTIVESEQGEGFDGLKGAPAAVKNEEIIKGVILKENQIIGIISGKGEFKEEEVEEEEENKVVQEDLGIISGKGDFKEAKSKPRYKSKGKDSNVGSKEPYLFIRTSVPIMGTSVLGRDSVINLFAKGFKLIPRKNNYVKIMIDSQVINQSAKVLQDGTVRAQLKVSEELFYGEHIVKVMQRANRKSITASGTFVKAAIDDFDEHMEGNNQQGSGANDRPCH